MTPSLTDTLCTRCGLCCDGSLFADVELAGRAEATRLEVMGLEIEDDDTNAPLLIQPCLALQGRRCGIYPHRPECCRTFECRLLQDARRGAISVERARGKIADALRQIGRVKELMAELGQRDGRLPLRERCAEALAREAGPDPMVNRKRDELDAAMSGVEKLIRKTFLGGVAIAALLSWTSPSKAQCPTAIAGVDSALAGSSIGFQLWRPFFQTFDAADTVLRAVTVWRIAAQDSNTIGITLTIVKADATGAPLTGQVVHPAIVAPASYGDGVHPVPVRFDFDPPVLLPARGRYSLAFTATPCTYYYDLLAVSDVSWNPANATWIVQNRDYTCALGRTIYPATLRLAYRNEYCDFVIPTGRETWGAIKVRYH